VRFKEHVQDFKHENKKSNFTKHLIENKHSLNSMENTMEIIHTTSKGRLLNVIEKFYIYKETKNNSQINDRHTVTPIVIFDTVLHKSNDSTLKAIYQWNPSPSIQSPIQLNTESRNMHQPHSECISD
jgi:hypothetical protein